MNATEIRDMTEAEAAELLDNITERLAWGGYTLEDYLAEEG